MLPTEETTHTNFSDVESHTAKQDTEEAKHSTKRRTILTLLVVFVLAGVATYIGVLSHQSHNDATDASERAAPVRRRSGNNQVTQRIFMDTTSDLNTRKTLANIGGLLAQCAWESGGDAAWKYCDENNWSGKANPSCTQRSDGKLYNNIAGAGQCAVDMNMKMKAVTFADWSKGNPKWLECTPGTGTAGCCWWGRGAIQTTGPLNYGLIQRDVLAKIGSKHDLCTNPEAVCQVDELKFVGTFYYWATSVQSDKCFGPSIEAYANSFNNAVNPNGCSKFSSGIGGAVNNGWWNSNAHGEAGRQKAFEATMGWLKAGLSSYDNKAPTSCCTGNAKIDRVLELSGVQAKSEMEKHGVYKWSSFCESFRMFTVNGVNGCKAAPAPAPAPKPAPAPAPSPAPGLKTPVVGYYSWSWGSGSYGPSGANAGIAFTGYTDVTASIANWKKSKGAAILKDTKWLSLGGGNNLGIFKAADLTDMASAGSIAEIKNAGFKGVMFDVEHTTGSSSTLIPLFRTAFKNMKSAGLLVAITVSHSAPYKCDTPQDAVALVKDWVTDKNVDVISPQLYTSGKEASPDFAETSSCKAAGCTWALYKNSVAHVAPSIVEPTHYQASVNYFKNIGINLNGYIIWKQIAAAPAPAPSPAPAPKPAPAPSPAPAVQCQSRAMWAQCGGKNFSNKPGCCPANAKCVYVGAWWSSCQPK